MNSYSVLRVLSYIFLALALIVAPFCIPTALALGAPQCNKTDITQFFPPYNYEKGCVNISTTILEKLLISMIIVLFSCLLIAIFFRILMKYCCKPIYHEILTVSAEEYIDPKYFNGSTQNEDNIYSPNSGYSESVNRYQRSPQSIPSTTSTTSTTYTPTQSSTTPTTTQSYTPTQSSTTQSSTPIPAYPLSYTSTYVATPSNFKYYY